MKSDDFQQCLTGFRTVEVLGGPCVVRVHEALDASMAGTPDRYFISVDFKFRTVDAINIGNFGYTGMRKAEATREAKALARQIAVARAVLDVALEWQHKNDSPTNRTTVLRQKEAFERITGRYRAEFITQS